MKYVLGIDIGTGSTKAVAVSLNGAAFADYQEHYGFNVPKPGYNEQNPEEIWEAFARCVRGIISKTGAQPAAIGLSSAMHSLIMVDKHCKPLAPMMTWADGRSFAIAKKLRASEEGMAIYRATGTPIHAMTPLCKLIWLSGNEPDLFKTAYKFMGIKEFIWYRLFNKFEVDHSIASGTGLFNLSDLKWHQPALKFAGIGAARLSAPVPTSYTRIYKGEDGFLDNGIPITIAASDGSLANLGSMVYEPGVAALTIGTSGAVRVASARPLPNEEAMTFSYIVDDKTFNCGGPVNNGGIAMQWWLKNFYGEKLTLKEYEDAFSEVSKAPAGADGLIFLPYLAGERAPIWDSETCGSFFGATLRHTKAHFTRAVLEGICFALRDVMEAVQQNAEPISQINISGGFVKSPVWVQILADIMGKNLAIVQSEDASAVGAAWMAMKANKFIDEYPLAVPADLKLVKPNPADAAICTKSFIIYKQLYTSLKNLMHRAAEQAG